MNVLIVDDNHAAAELLQELIELQDHTAVCAFSAQQALDAVQRQDFVLGFIDLTLPDQPGAEVARQMRLRATERDQRLVLVAVSGYGPNDPAGKQAAPHFDHFLQKPIDFDALDRLLAATAAAAAA
ncbi:MAG: response regulator [Comamonadaceae bacterium]|nr:MAG: response regulator [Comamonadaceae bacterium]